MEVLFSLGMAMGGKSTFFAVRMVFLHSNSIWDYILAYLNIYVHARQEPIRITQWRKRCAGSKMMQ